MKRMLIACLAAAAVGAPALAQYAPPPPGNWQRGPDRGPGGWNPQHFWQGAPPGARERIDYLQNRINFDASRGQLNPEEVRVANDGIRQIRQMVRQMHVYDGRLTPRDNYIVQQRLDALTVRVHQMAHNNW